MIKTLATIAISLAAVTGSASAKALDATAPVVKNPDIHMALETGYIGHGDLLADIRGTDRDGDHDSRQ
uniref:Uncharacterized protein n=1 Tax=Ochrobactrum sp. LM19 TaxID=1449781 RepID=A0A0D5A1B7_9HYPH|nr:hypothetical protein [Ochrobactrum sp. LM19]AJW29976.1 hypothetical protein pLM19O2_p31 [Ochrobactrum sp. LM19]